MTYLEHLAIRSITAQALPAATAENLRKILRVTGMSDYRSAQDLADFVGYKPNGRATMTHWLERNHWRFLVDKNGLPNVSRAHRGKKLGLNNETNSAKLDGMPNLQSAMDSRTYTKLAGATAWVGFCLYVIDKGPGFICAVGDQMFGLTSDMPTPGAIMQNTFGLAALIGALAVGVGAIPLVRGTAGNIVLVVMLLVLAVGMYFAVNIFMLQLQLGLIVMLSPLSFSLLGLNALRDQGIAPFKSLLALAYPLQTGAS